MGGATGDMMLGFLTDSTGSAAAIVSLMALTLAALLLFFCLGLPLLSYVLFGRQVHRGVGASGSVIQMAVSRSSISAIASTEEAGQRAPNAAGSSGPSIASRG